MSSEHIDGRTIKGKRYRGESKLLANGLIHGKPYVDEDGYLRALDPRYPNRPSRRVHRIIMEHHLGRLLRIDEHVHHKDHNPGNNDIDNLQIIERQSHIELHATPWVPIVCPVCGIKRQLRKQEADTYTYNAHKKCLPILLSRALRERNALRYFWFVWPTNDFIGPFETRKDATAGAPKTAKQKDRTLIIGRLKTGEVKPASRRRALPDSVCQRARALMERLAVPAVGP